MPSQQGGERGRRFKAKSWWATNVREARLVSLHFLPIQLRPSHSPAISPRSSRQTHRRRRSTRTAPRDAAQEILPPQEQRRRRPPPAMKKPRAGKQWPKGMSNTASAVDVARRAIVNHDQHKQEAAAKMKKAATAAAAATSYGPPHCPGVFGTQSRVSSPTSLLSSSLAAFQEGHCWCQNDVGICS
jgi:hypothetical protein